MGALLLPAVVGFFGARLVPASHAAPVPSSNERPRYTINLQMDWSLLTFSATARVDVPASPADPLPDASFFLFANANGVGGAGQNQLNLVVDEVFVNGQKAAWKLNGPVLKVRFPSPQSETVRVQVRYHGLVPRSAGDNSLMSGMMGTDISSLLGGATGQATPAKTEPSNTDYGLYTATPSIVSLGSFWSPTLAVRQNGRWVDAPPDGLGDVAYAVKSDYHVALDAPADMTVVGPGRVSRQGEVVSIDADDVRDCALLASRAFVLKTQTIQLGDHPVAVTVVATREHAGRLDECLSIATHALAIYSKRFGAYPFAEFKVVEAPMKSGAGGMEYSRMVGIASALYEPTGKQLGGMISSLNLPGADQLLQSLGDDTLSSTKAPAQTDEANGMSDAIGGMLGQQKATLDSLLEVTIAHEVAHQWWAIGVGSDSQRDPWVDEALTNWCALLYFEDRYGRERADQMRELHLKTAYSMGAALGGGDRPANLPSGAYANNLQYGAVVYGKAALFYDHLRALVGDDAFFGALRDYYARYNDRLATAHSLRETMDARSPQKKAQIEALYKRWIEEAHGKEDIGAGAAGDLTQMIGNIFGGGGLGKLGDE